MKKSLLVALIVCILHNVSTSQVLKEPPSLSLQQQDRLKAVQEVKASSFRAPLTLPYSVDNSELPFFRPLFQQVGLECGQASSIGLGLTYELNALRNLPGNVPQNQMATHFTYNFLNGGANAGVSFLESWEIVKRVGNPSVLDYGGLSYGGPARWMSGYNLYYNAMHNRITDVGVIYINTVEGLNTLRNWIYNHLGATSVGGVANFYSQTMTVTQQLPAGTTFGGQYVITAFGSNPNHAMTILGYNDSIRYDYNGDGQFTNNIDINGDGILDLKDWEIGGFKIANTYGSITNWANQGYAWAMYKAFAENPSSGGIWNNAAYISFAKQDLSPKLTMKVTLKHTSRNKLKVIAGVSNNLAASEPDVTLNLPILDYQGGDLYMTGGTTEADKTIELGLDATPLLSEITNGQPAKFFLIIIENDPSNTATGQVVSFDLVDYTSGTVVIPGGYSNIPLVENGTTTLTINATITANKPSIQNTSLPEAKLYEPYNQQLTTNGGTTPYKWRMAIDYSEYAGSAPFNAVSAQQLTVNNTSSGYATKELPFAFPFYGKTYTTVYPHVDGYLMFEDHTTPWPYIIYEKTFFKNYRTISPYMGKPLVIASGEGDGIWYQGCSDSATFRWKVSVYGSTPTTDFNFSVTLFPDGRIKFNYGSMNSTAYMTWIAGLSNGDGLNYHFSAITDSLSQPVANSMFLFSSQPFPTELSLSENGLLSGTPLHSYQNLPLRFYVEDNNFLYNIKTLNFKTKGVEINYQVSSGNDTIIEYGEVVQITPVLKNVSNTTLHNVVMRITTHDPYITLTDSVETIGTLAPGQSVTFPGAFRFSVANSVPDAHLIDIVNHVIASEDVFNRTMQLQAWSGKPEITHVAVFDGNNNILMPGEIATLLVTLKNSGGSEITNINTILRVIDPYIIITQANAAINILEAGSTQLLTYAIRAGAGCPAGHIGGIGFSLTGAKDISLTDSIYVNIGPIVEDFETGNYNRFPWQFAGNSNWSISQSSPFEGIYCSQSGTITDNQECSMYLTLNILSPSDISFYRKVSSETNYDFLYFYIDGQEKGKWSGEVPWGKVTYPVPEGTHRLSWKYKKDYSISTGSDKAWVDYIEWPPISNMLLIANAGPDDIACSGQGYQLSGQVLNASGIYWTSNGDGYFTNINSPQAIYYPGSNDLLFGQVTLTIHASAVGLPGVTDNVTLTVIPGPACDAGPNEFICSGSNFTINQSSASNYLSLHWNTSGDGAFDIPSSLHPTYTPGTNDIVNGSVNLTLTAYGNTECMPVTDNMLLTIYPAVVANAGTDQSILFNTPAQLSGSASGGSGTFSASWQPASLLVNPTIFNPITVPLLTSQVFTLTATNNISGCSSSDQVTITVIGGPLAVIAYASPGIVCPGGSSQLSAMGSGGSGVYTFQWTSDPPGFTSNIQNPVVSPSETTLYTVEINDGSLNASSDVTVTVNSVPAIPSRPNGPVAVNVLNTAISSYTTTGSANTSQFNWNFSPYEAGSINSYGQSCDVHWNNSFNGTAALSVVAQNECGSSASSDTLFITANYEVGIHPVLTSSGMTIAPNPGEGIFNITFSTAGFYHLKVLDYYGKIIKETELKIDETTPHYRLDISGFPSGIYFLRAAHADRLYTGKLTLISR